METNENTKLETYNNVLEAAHEKSTSLFDYFPKCLGLRRNSWHKTVFNMLKTDSCKDPKMLDAVYKYTSEDINRAINFLKIIAAYIQLVDIVIQCLANNYSSLLMSTKKISTKEAWIEPAWIVQGFREDIEDRISAAILYTSSDGTEQNIGFGIDLNENSFDPDMSFLDVTINMRSWGIVNGYIKKIKVRDFNVKHILMLLNATKAYI